MVYSYVVVACALVIYLVHTYVRMSLGFRHTYISSKSLVATLQLLRVLFPVLQP